MTLNEMIALVRQDLHNEEASSYRWSDAALTRHINRAVKELSEALPLPSKASINTLSGSREISLATLTGRVNVQAVEYPLGRFPPAYIRFALWGDSLTLLGETAPTGGYCCVYYGREHTLSAAASTIPSIYENLVALGAAALAAVELSLYTTNRINQGGPQTPEQLFTWGTEQLRHFRSELKRLGRRHQLKVSRLYRATLPEVSRSGDPGPG